MKDIEVLGPEVGQELHELGALMVAFEMAGIGADRAHAKGQEQGKRTLQRFFCGGPECGAGFTW